MIRGGLHGGVIGFFFLASLRRSVLDFIDTPLIYGMNTHGYGHGHRGISLHVSSGAGLRLPLALFVA